MSTTAPFNLTIVLPPNRQYYVSYFYPYAYSGNTIAACKYKSNVTTALEEDWHTADIYNEFWKDNPTRGDPITGNIYRVPFIFDYNVQFAFSACTYFIFSWYEGNELKYFVYTIDRSGGHSVGTYESYTYRQNIVTDEYGSLLAYVGFLNDYAMQVYAPGRKICNYTLGINDALFRTSSFDKGVNNYNLNTFPYDVLVNGYYVVTYPDNVIDGTYQLQDGYNIGYKIPELTNGSLKNSLGKINWYVAFPEDDYITIYRFKFTKTNDSDPNRTLFRIMHLHVTQDTTGILNMYGDLWIDSETKELKIWSWSINPEPVVLKQLTNDALYAWHELAIPWATYGDLKGFYWDGEYIDLVEICGDTVTTSFRQHDIAGFPEVGAGEHDVGIGKNKSILLDYAALHINSSSYPYVMGDNYFKYYEPILPEPEPEPEPEEPTGIIIKGHVYLVCYKGDTSIYDNLIRIIKTNIASKLPSPKPDFYKGIFIPPLHEPPHLNNLLPRGYPVHDYHPIPDINSDYTHVGLLVAHKNMLIPEEITYYACREDNGVSIYSEPIKCVDLFDLKHLTVPVKQIDSFYNKTKNIEGSVVGDMGYRIMMRPNSMSSIEWVARALNLGFPKRYTINKLIKFSKIEE